MKLYIFCISVILDGISELNALAAWCCNSFIFIASRRQPENKYFRLRELEGLCGSYVTPPTFRAKAATDAVEMNEQSCVLMNRQSAGFSPEILVCRLLHWSMVGEFRGVCVSFPLLRKQCPTRAGVPVLVRNGFQAWG